MRRQPPSLFHCSLKYTSTVNDLALVIGVDMAVTALAVFANRGGGGAAAEVDAEFVTQVGAEIVRLQLRQKSRNAGP